MATGFDPTSYQLTARNPADADTSTLRFVPTIDAIAVTLGAIGMYNCVISTTAPTTDLYKTVWICPGTPAFTTPATILLYDNDVLGWVNASTRPDLWHNLFNTQSNVSVNWNKTDW